MRLVNFRGHNNNVAYVQSRLSDFRISIIPYQLTPDGRARLRRNGQDGETATQTDRIAASTPTS